MRMSTLAQGVKSNACNIPVAIAVVITYPIVEQYCVVLHSNKLSFYIHFNSTWEPWLNIMYNTYLIVS